MSICTSLYRCYLKLLWISTTSHHLFIHNNCVYVEIRKGMYTAFLFQAGKLANDQLIEALAPFGYCHVPITASLLHHDTRDTTFCLVVDNFGIKYTNQHG
jgi:hypothetical protein